MIQSKFAYWSVFSDVRNRRKGASMVMDQVPSVGGRVWLLSCNLPQYPWEWKRYGDMILQENERFPWIEYRDASDWFHRSRSARHGCWDNRYIRVHPVFRSPMLPANHGWPHAGKSRPHLCRIALRCCPAGKSDWIEATIPQSDTKLFGLYKRSQANDSDSKCGSSFHNCLQ